MKKTIDPSLHVGTFTSPRWRRSTIQNIIIRRKHRGNGFNDNNNNIIDWNFLFFFNCKPRNKIRTILPRIRA